MIHKFQSQSKSWVPFLGFVFYRGTDVPLKNLNIIKPHIGNTTKHKIKHHKILTNLCCTRTCAPICHHSILFKLALFFVCFSYLSHNIPYHPISSLKFAVLILNETFRRGKAQIMHKKWTWISWMGPLQNTKPSMPNIQHHLYKIEVHPICPHQNKTRKCKKLPLQNHCLAN